MGHRFQFANCKKLPEATHPVRSNYQFDQFDVDLAVWEGEFTNRQDMYMDMYMYIDIYTLVIWHSHGKWPIYRWFSQLQTSIYGWDFPWLC